MIEMTIIAASLGGTDAANGDLADVDDVVETFGCVPRVVLNDSTSVSAGQGASVNREYATITAANIAQCDYILINMRFYGFAELGSCKITLESKEVGGSYGYDINAQAVATNGVNLANPDATGGGGTLSHLHALTAGEKANGIIFKVTAICEGSVGQSYGLTIYNVNAIRLK